MFDLKSSICHGDISYLRFCSDTYLSKKKGLYLKTDLSSQNQYKIVYCPILDEDKSKLNKRFKFVKDGQHLVLQMKTRFRSSWVYDQDQIFLLVCREN